MPCSDPRFRFRAFWFLVSQAWISVSDGVWVLGTTGLVGLDGGSGGTPEACRQIKTVYSIKKVVHMASNHLALHTFEELSWPNNRGVKPTWGCHVLGEWIIKTPRSTNQDVSCCVVYFSLVCHLLVVIICLKTEHPL